MRARRPGRGANEGGPRAGPAHDTPRTEVVPMRRARGRPLGARHRSLLLTVPQGAEPGRGAAESRQGSVSSRGIRLSTARLRWMPLADWLCAEWSGGPSVAVVG